MEALTTYATKALTSLLYKSCHLQSVTQTVSSETWADGVTISCMYEESSPAQQGTLDYSGGAGYGYDVWLDPDQTITAGDRIVVDGMTFKVLEASKVGAPGPLKRLRTQRIA